jgi:small subunit ribosomal protein S16
MVKIRLSRTGRKNLATYRIVITPAREKRESNFIEQVGFYLPHDKKIEINKERVEYWMSVGAQPTETVKALLIKQGIVKAPKHKKTYSHKPGKKSQERASKKATKSEKAPAAE